jgi:hypothetical protein
LADVLDQRTGDAIDEHLMAGSGHAGSVIDGVDLAAADREVMRVDG